MMGSGKTTLALRDVANAPRVIVYTPGHSNRGLLDYPYIYDEPHYLKDWATWIERYPRLRIEKRVSPSTVFRLLAGVRGRYILLDDVTALKTTPEERNDFEAFVRTVRFNGNRLILTTHRVRKDIPRLVHVIGTSFYWVGPGVRSRPELDAMYDLVNYPIDYWDFCKGIETRKWGEAFPLRKAAQ